MGVLGEAENHTAKLAAPNCLKVADPSREGRKNG